MVVQLNIHTCYDLLHSTVRIDALIEYAKENQQKTLSITDTNVLFGVQKFYKACMDNDIKPIIGMETIVTDGLNRIETVILAKNNEGYKALIQLSSRIQLSNKDEIDLKTFNTYTENWVVIYKNIQQDAKHFLEELDTVYVCHNSTIDTKKVYIQPVRYLKSETAQDLDVLNAIDRNEKLVLETLALKTGRFDFKTLAQLEDIDPECIKNTEIISQMCQVDLSTLKAKMPKFTTESDLPSDKLLLSEIQTRQPDWMKNDATYQKRIQYEYEVIQSMGFSDYFLIVSDLINYAKNKGIRVGPGRGSSSGSLISYILNITEIDPIKNDLLFERFLNPERITMPDIDIDFEDKRRDEVIQYVKEKYGNFKVSGIVTFGHLLAKAVIRDVGRILQFSEAELKFASDHIPKELGVTIEKALEQEALYSFFNENERRKKWLNIAQRLEGLPRHTSTHAAAIVIHDQLLTDYVPLIEGDLVPLTQWTMTEVEAIGLLKIDFLGLRNLSIIENILKSIYRTDGKRIDLHHIDYEDPQVFKQLSLGETTGIFQLESSGIRKVIKNLKPNQFNDIVAVLSLYRPGPMEQIPTYIERRHGQHVSYIDESIRDILQSTYGVIIYQEQIMQIANTFAGFGYGEADLLRRAMSKKNMGALLKEKAHFIEGAIQLGHDQSTAEAVYELILKFANYGFPKAHAVSYATISYQMMYLKVHYPNHFYAATLSNVIHNDAKTKALIQEVKARGIQLIAPSINHANYYYQPKHDGIVIPLGIIKGVGHKSVEEIINERKKGAFKDIYDFCERISSRVKTRALLEAMIYVGAFDCFNETRTTLLQSLDEVLNIAQEGHDQDSLLQLMGLKKKKIYHYAEEMSEQQKLEYEKEYLGFYLTQHPITLLFNQYQYLPIYQLSHHINYQHILISIESIKRIRTKKGQPMAFIKITDGIEEMDAVVFPKTFHMIEHQLIANEPLLMKGKYDAEKNQYIVDAIISLKDYHQNALKQAKQLYVLKRHKDTVLNDKGDIEVFENQGKSFTSIGWIDKNQLTSTLNQYQPDEMRLI